MKPENQPHGQRLGRLKNGNPPCDLSKLPRCNATSKTTGQRCRQAAMENGKCHWHGGKSTGAPKGNVNALKHGLYTREAKKTRQRIRELIRRTNELLAQCGSD